MKCNIKDLKTMTPRSREILLNSLANLNEKILNEKYEEIKEVLSNNLLKFFVVACNETYGLGKIRIEKLLISIIELTKDMQDDNDDLFIMVEEKCKKILGAYTYNLYFQDIPFKALPTDYNLIENN